MVRFIGNAEEIRLVNLLPGSAPGSPSEGDLYYDTVAKVLKLRNDTAFLDLLTEGSGIEVTDFTAKGDMLIATGAGTYIALGVGTDGYILTANSGESTGVAWTIPAGDINEVIAGAGLTGGGSSGSVTLDAVGGNGIYVSANSFAVDLSATSGLSFLTGALEIDDSVAGWGLDIVNKIIKIDPSDTSIFDTSVLTNTVSKVPVCSVVKTYVDATAKQYTQAFTTQTIIIVSHSLARYPIVQILDSSGYVVIPDEVQHTTTSSFTVTFSVATTGTIVYVG